MADSSPFATLDDIIQQKAQALGQAGGGSVSGGGAGGSSPGDITPEEYGLAIKMLITNSQAGALIGSHGNAVKELIQITSARVSVSDHNYPRTTCRTVYITGSEESVGHAASMVVELVAQEEMAKLRNNREAWTWSPREVSANGGRTTNVDVDVSITVPASSAGLLLGKGGSVKRAIEEESGCKLAMSDKSDPSAELTHERMIILTGKVSCVINGLYLILDKLSSDLEAAQFVVKGTTFGQGVKSFLTNPSGRSRSGGRGAKAARTDDGEGDGNRGSGNFRAGGRGGGRGGDDSRRGGGGGDAPFRELYASTVVELAVHDSHVGSILGPGGTKLRDIMSLSGASITISNRSDLTEGSRDRKVTIDGSPSCVKTAKELVLHILSQQAQS